ncbi:MAG: ribulose-phosphate 3-epimerase [Promicromonosporaceae bacterium]|nr:ribulose-phosphate 3-epimerase [Promicromonosporaceae bacterium]
MASRIHPSILAADFANLERELNRIAMADMAHVDVMDAHFVPNLTIGLPVVRRLAQVSPLPLDVHLMIDDPDRWAPKYVEAGAASVTFHAEAAADAAQLARHIRQLGAQAAIAVRPATPVEPILDLLAVVDMVLIMTVEPGFGGQSFMAETLPKIAQVRAEITARGCDTAIQVDGGISRKTIKLAADAGANVFVAGSAVFGVADVAAEIAALRSLADVHSC